MGFLRSHIPTDVGQIRRNVATKVTRGKFADLREMPRVAVSVDRDFTLYRYQESPDATTYGQPVFIIPPLAAPALAFDLRRGCSVVEYFVNLGRPVYLIDYGPVDFRHRQLGIENWIDHVVPTTMRHAAEHAGLESSGLHAMGWSLGGIFTMLAAAAHPDLPWQSVTAVASPFDLRQVPLLAIARPFDRLVSPIVTPAYRAMGGVPAPLTKLGFQISSWDKYLTKPISIATHLDDADYLAQLEAVSHFMDNMYAYPGRTFGQLYHVVMRSNEFASGEMKLGSSTVRLSEVKVPAHVVAGVDDTLAPRPAVEHLVPLLTGSPEVELTEAPGGHLGVLTGRAARNTTWPALEEFFARFDD